MADTLFRTFTWGCPGRLIGTSLNFGTGPSNTINITNTCSTMLNAASLCFNLVHSGKSDWFLPSKGEIAKISRKFSLETLSTSSECDSNDYWGYLSIPPINWWPINKAYQRQPNDECPAIPFRYF